MEAQTSAQLRAALSHAVTSAAAAIALDAAFAMQIRPTTLECALAAAYAAGA